MKKNQSLVSLGLLGEGELMYDKNTKSYKRVGEDDFTDLFIGEGNSAHSEIPAPKKKSKIIDFIRKPAKKTLDIEELVSEVNKFDKEFDIKPKHMVKWRDPKEYLKILVNKSNFVITSLISLINGVDIGVYARNSFNDQVFTDFSQLDWDSDNTYKDTDPMFRCKFLTLILVKFLGNVKKVTSKINKQHQRKHSFNEYSIVDISKIMKHLLIFVNALLNNTEYKNVILKINEYMSYFDKDADQLGCKKLILKLISNIREGFNYDIISGRQFYDEDMAIDDILKLSYVLSTNDDNFDRLPKFKHVKGASLKYDLSGLIVAYGEEISKYEGCYNPMFQAYIEAHPKIYTDFYLNAEQDEEFLIGLYALGFTRFVLHSKQTDKFISQMMKTGE